MLRKGNSGSFVGAQREFFVVKNKRHLFRMRLQV